MPTRRSRLFALPVAVGVCVALLSGCGGSSGGGPSASTSPTGSLPAPVVTAAGPVPTVTGGFGEKPTITIPTETPAVALVTKTVVTGTGPEVKSGDLLVVNYVGMTWDDKHVFDSSFDRGQPTTFAIGVGDVIKGWDAALVGQTVGSRVVMAIPPALGYGSTGQPQAGISADDTLVFVVDILGAYPSGVGSAAGSTPTGADLTGLPSVTGVSGTRPTITVAAGTTPPKKNAIVVLDKGDGATITAGSFLILQYEAVSWGNKTLGSTWKNGQAQGVGVGLAASPSPFDALVGQTVGTRVLLLLPSQGSGDPAADSAAVVVDILDAIPPTST